MRIRFIGASDDHVTGSCTHFSYDRKEVQFLVDCGLHQGENHALFKNRKKFPFDAADIKFVLLTHAHINHCGLIPKLYRDGFQGVVFCTTATAQLARLSLLDSVRFSAGLYSEDDVKAIQFSCVDPRKYACNRGVLRRSQVSASRTGQEGCGNDHDDVPGQMGGLCH